MYCGNQVTILAKSPDHVILAITFKTNLKLPHEQKFNVI